jgi:uncharacterized protein YxeA
MISGSFFKSRPSTAVAELGEKEPAVKDSSNGIPDDKGSQSEDDAVYQPDNNARLQSGSENEAYLTGAFQLIDTHYLRYNRKSSEKAGDETQIFNGRQGEASLK